jgi:AcrR family transcriptional regulator
MKTRERILQTSLALFNDQGEPNVTTNHIADELDISPGNLYYHFRNKGRIVEELFDRFEAQIDPVLHAPESREPDMEDMWLYLHVLFENIRDYRFFYRDLNDLLGRYPSLEEPFRVLLARKRQTAYDICYGLAEAGIMSASHREVRVVAENIALLMTFWLGYSNAAQRRSEDNLADGVYHVMSLVVPFLDGPERLMFSRLSESYLSPVSDH